MSAFPIYHVSFPSQYALTSTLLRFQEHYESPKFRSQFFDLEEFMDWYASCRGVFSYYTDWSGFNFPSRILTPFRMGCFDPLSRKERAFLDLFAGMYGDFYVIGTAAKGDPRALAHEITHGLFYTNSDYASDVLATLHEYRLTAFRKAILDIGYHPDVLEDECNAFLTTGLSKFLRGKSVREVPAARQALLTVFRQHFGIDPSTAAGRAWLIQRIACRTFDPPKNR